MAKATLPVAPHVERLLLQSKKSERLGYVLGKEREQARTAQPHGTPREPPARSGDWKAVCLCHTTQTANTGSQADHATER